MNFIKTQIILISFLLSIQSNIFAAAAAAAPAKVGPAEAAIAVALDEAKKKADGAVVSGADAGTLSIREKIVVEINKIPELSKLLLVFGKGTLDNILKEINYIMPEVGITLLQFLLITDRNAADNDYFGELIKLLFDYGANPHKLIPNNDIIREMFPDFIGLDALDCAELDPNRWFLRPIIQEALNNTCATCSINSSTKKLFSCGKCNRSKYCSKECQKKDWTHGHKERCPNLHLYLETKNAANILIDFLNNTILPYIVHLRSLSDSDIYNLSDFEFSKSVNLLQTSSLQLDICNKFREDLMRKTPQLNEVFNNSGLNRLLGESMSKITPILQNFMEKTKLIRGCFTCKTVLGNLKCEKCYNRFCNSCVKSHQSKRCKKQPTPAKKTISKAPAVVTTDATQDPVDEYFDSFKVSDKSPVEVTTAKPATTSAIAVATAAAAAAAAAPAKVSPAVSALATAAATVVMDNRATASATPAAKPDSDSDIEDELEKESDAKYLAFVGKKTEAKPAKKYSSKRPTIQGALAIMEAARNPASGRKLPITIRDQSVLRKFDGRGTWCKMHKMITQGDVKVQVHYFWNEELQQAARYKVKRYLEIN